MYLSIFQGGDYMPSQTLLAIILLWWMFNYFNVPPKKKTKKGKDKSPSRFASPKQDVLLFLMILTIISPDILSEFIKIVQLLQ